MGKRYGKSWTGGDKNPLSLSSKRERLNGVGFSDIPFPLRVQMNLVPNPIMSLMFRDTIGGLIRLPPCTPCALMHSARDGIKTLDGGKAGKQLFYPLLVREDKSFGKKRTEGRGNTSGLSILAERACDRVGY